MALQRSPRELNGSDLVLSYFSLDRQHPMEDRVAAAAAAGFAGIGLYIGEFQRLQREGLAGGWLDEILDRHGMCIAEIEVVRGWAQNGDAHDACLAMEASAWEMADRFGCRYLQAIGPYDGTIDEAGRAYGALCDRAAEHGLVVGLEFLPFTNIVNAADALHMVEVANRPNGGVCVDIWHHIRGANDLALVRAIPAEIVMGVQMSDGTLAPENPDYLQDCLRNRVAPGSGEFGAMDFVRTLIDMGVNVPWGMEVCNDSVWGQPALAHVQAIADGMRATLVRARGEAHAG
jgi:sugar phosphate isomerase/epimerase